MAEASAGLVQAKTPLVMAPAVPPPPPAVGVDATLKSNAGIVDAEAAGLSAAGAMSAGPSGAVAHTSSSLTARHLNDLSR